MDKDTLYEGRTHGDTMFPIGVYEVVKLDNDKIFNYHWHQEAEFIYMAEGVAWFQIGASTVTLHQGEALFIRSGELHAGYPVNDLPFRMMAIVFDMNLLSSHTYDHIQNKYMDPLIKQSLLLPEQISGSQPWEQAIISDLIHLIDDYAQKKPAYELRMKADLYLIFAELISHGEWVAEAFVPLADSSKIDRLKQVLQYIHDHYQNKIQVSDLAGLLSMSEGHFCRYFKSILRQTPIEYVNSIRINQAIQLLRNPNNKIIDISMDVGFENPSYFIKTFKRYKQCTPSEFRKLLNIYSFIENN